ncbi:MAG: nucleotide sugar dehydrogenase, partial [Acidimicrobiia bacterium]|nr:nucleotide sugar dehydrogenase [Acidimicrobiia bacterium]
MHHPVCPVSKNGTVKSALTKVAVVGQGYVGLPLAMRTVEVGHDVVGFDVDPARIKRLLAGESYVEDVSAETLAAALNTGRYHPTTEAKSLGGFDVAVITVPTPLREGNPDLSYIESASTTVARFLRPGACVILESTTYPGTTEELVGPLLEEGSGLTAGADFHLGYSPERIDPGNPTWGLVNTPKVVSGVDEASLAAVESFYAGIAERT